MTHRKRVGNSAGMNGKKKKLGTFVGITKRVCGYVYVFVAAHICRSFHQNRKPNGTVHRDKCKDKRWFDEIQTILCNENRNSN